MRLDVPLTLYAVMSMISCVFDSKVKMDQFLSILNKIHASVSFPKKVGRTAGIFG